MEKITLEKKIKCSFCGEIAYYDGKTIFGPWAYMCEKCFIDNGISLGIGKGQKINYNKSKK